MINNCFSRTLHVEVCLAWMKSPAGTVRFMQDKKNPLGADLIPFR